MPEEALTWQQVAIPFAFMLLLLGFFWFIVVRPTQTRQKKHQDLVAGIMPGDDIVTVGGLYGKIRKVGDKMIELEIAKDTVVRMDRRAIRRLQSQEDF